MQTHLVVGGGQAGAHAAMAMRRAGFPGRVVLVGAESAPPYDRPPLSKAFLSSSDPVPLAYHFTPMAYDLENVELLTGVAVDAIDPPGGWVHLARGGVIGFDRLILATGSSPRRPTMPGAERIMVLRTYGDATRIRRSLVEGTNVVCIGAGVIGLEIASAARTRGCKVSVVELAPSVMARSLPAELAIQVEDIHRRAGVEFVFGEGVAAVEPTMVLLTGGARLPADVVIAGVGVERNLALARSANVAISRGILVDPHGRTNVDGIYAAGEVAEYFSARAGGHVIQESWQHAQDHGSHVGRVVAGVDLAYDEVPWFWSDQHGVNIQVAGHPLNARHGVFRGAIDANTLTVFYLDDDDRVVGAVGFNSGADVSAGLRLIRESTSVDPAALADPDTSLRHLVRTASQRSSR